MNIVLFLVGLLVPSESQYLDTYADSTCSMGAVAGRNGNLGVCQDSKIATCLGSTLYVSLYGNTGCAGTSTNVTLSQGVCEPGIGIGGYKGYCSGSTSAPSGAVTFKEFNSGQCSGSSVTSWFSLNKCIPDGPTTLTSSMYTQGQGGYIQTMYSTGSCSGQPTGTSFLPKSYSYSTYYAPTSATFSNMAFVLQYANPQCTGSPYSGQAVSANLVGKCDGQGTMVSCSNGVANLTTYDNYNCTGNPLTQNLTTTSGCDNGAKATCAGTLTISGPFAASANYNANGCQGSVQNIYWYAINSCVLTGLSSFQFTYSASGISQESYMSQDCTGASTSSPVSQGGSGTSSSVLTAVVSKFITATTILILSSYLFA